jgi:signal transduction histidine kinase
MGAVFSLAADSGTPVRQNADPALPGEILVHGTHATVGGRPVAIITFTTTDPLKQVNETFGRLLGIGLPVILLLTCGTVWLVVGRALRPVERIRRTVTEITAADLSRRVPQPAARDEIGQLAHTMNDMLGRLEDSARRQRRFVADASHELRSPLAAIRTSLDVGLAHPQTAPWPQIAQRAARQSERLETLIHQLLVLAKSDDRQLATRRVPVDLVQLVDEVKATSLAEGVEIDVVRRDDAVAVGDPESLSRLVRNIVDNAVRYASRQVRISVIDSPPEGVGIEIADDGPGIPAAERERVFDRFVRLDASRDRATGSSGLGLAIAQEIASAHDGSITIDEAPAGGALVAIRLPRAEAESGTQVPGAGRG